MRPASVHSAPPQACLPDALVPFAVCCVAQVGAPKSEAYSWNTQINRYYGDGELNTSTRSASRTCKGVTFVHAPVQLRLPWLHACARQGGMAALSHSRLLHIHCHCRYTCLYSSVRSHLCARPRGHCLPADCQQAPDAGRWALHALERRACRVRGAACAHMLGSRMQCMRAAVSLHCMLIEALEPCCLAKHTPIRCHRDRSSNPTNRPTCPRCRRLPE